MKEAWLGHVNYLNFGRQQPYLWNGLSHWPSTSVYSNHSRREALRPAGLSAAAETCTYSNAMLKGNLRSNALHLRPKRQHNRTFS